MSLIIFMVLLWGCMDDDLTFFEAALVATGLAIMAFVMPVEVFLWWSLWTGL